jgi:hypothetical protein
VNLTSPFHHDALAGVARLNEENSEFLFEPISDRSVDFYPARIERVCVVGFDMNDRPPRSSWISITLARCAGHLKPFDDAKMPLPSVSH